MPIHFRFILTAILLIFSSFLIFSQRQRIVDSKLFPDHSLATSRTPAPLETSLPVKIEDDPDLDNLLRTQEQCNLDFPDLYDAIDTSVEHYRNNPLNFADLDEIYSDAGYTWVIIRNNKLYVRSRHNGFQSRVQAVLADLHRAIITSPERLPDIEFLFSTADSAPDGKYTPVFGLSRGIDERQFLIPDFGYWSWPEPHVNGFTSFEDQAQILEKETPWSKKKKQLFWRGAAKLNDERGQLVAMSEVHNTTWGNVRNIDWENLKDDDRYDMADHCQFQFLAHIEGSRYSARLKYLQHCNSVIVTHERKWSTHLSHLLKPSGVEQNVVVVGPDFNDVDQVMNDLLNNKEKSKKIAKNSQELFGEKYGRLGAEVCYWRALIRGYRSIMSADFRKLVGERYDKDMMKDYESVMLMGKTEWEIA